MSNRDDLESRLRSYLAAGARTQPGAGMEERIASKVFRRGSAWAFQLLAAAAVLILAIGLGIGLNRARELSGVTATPTVSPSTNPTASAKPSPNSQATPTPGSVYPLAGVASMHMVNASTGWAAGSGTDRIIRTTDGGAHWDDVTPRQARLGNWTTFFADANNAWLASSLQPGSPASDFTVEMYRTSDGGRTWSHAGTAKPDWGFPSAVNFVDGQHGWLFMRQDGTQQALGSDLVAFYGTSDGGASWSKLSEADGSGGAGLLPVTCSKGAPVFSNARTGWLPAGCTVDAVGPYFYVTRDGGYTWQEVRFPLPAGWTRNCLCSITGLRFSDARNGVFVLTVPSSSGLPQSVLYATGDGGTSWRPGPSLPTQATDVFFIDPTHGWTIDGKANSVLFTADGGRRWSAIGTSASSQGPVDIQFITMTTGWIMGAEPRGRTILKTVDGGATWVPQLGPTD